MRGRRRIGSEKRDFKDAVLPGLDREEGAMSPGMRVPLGAGKGEKAILSWSLQKE